MRKTYYQRPAIRVRAIAGEEEMLAASLNGGSQKDPKGPSKKLFDIPVDDASVDEATDEWEE